MLSQCIHNSQQAHPETTGVWEMISVSPATDVLPRILADSHTDCSRKIEEIEVEKEHDLSQSFLQ